MLLQIVFQIISVILSFKKMHVDLSHTHSFFSDKRPLSDLYQNQTTMNSHTAAPLQMIMGGERVSYGNSSMREGCDNPGGLWVERMCVYGGLL